MIFHDISTFQKSYLHNQRRSGADFFYELYTNFILYHKLIPGKFQLESSSFHGDRVEKPPKNDEKGQFYQHEKSWFWWIPKNRILESKMWNSKKNFKSCLLVVVYHHHEGYRCISSSYFRRGPTSWSIFMKITSDSVLYSAIKIYELSLIFICSHFPHFRTPQFPHFRNSYFFRKIGFSNK